MINVELKAAEYGLMEETTQPCVGAELGTANGPFSVQQCLFYRSCGTSRNWFY